MLNCTLLQPFVIANAVRVAQSPNFLLLLNGMLTSAGIDIRHLGIRLPYHRSPRASHHYNSYHFTVFIMSFFFTESQYGIAKELSHFFLLVYG